MNLDSYSVTTATMIPVTVPAFKEKLVNKVIETMVEIVSDNQRRLEGYHQDITLLSNGIFYGSEYFNALKEMNQKKSLDYYTNKGSFYHGYAPIKYFKMLNDPSSPTGILASCYVIKDDVAPSAALAAIRKGPTFIDCSETCQIGYFEAIKEVIGTEKFDHLFSAKSSTPFKIDLFGRKILIDCLLKRYHAPVKFSKGQIVHFLNVPMYSSKHLNGDASGYFSICCDDTPGNEKFTTLGLQPKGMTHSEINERMCEDFNKMPIPMDFLTREAAINILSSLTTKDLRIVKHCKYSRISMEEFKELEGGKINCIMELNAKRINKLANSSLEEAAALFNKWQN